MTIKLEHPHVKAVFGRKKNCPVKIGPRNGGFSEIKGPNIKYSHQTFKRHFLTRNDVI